MKRAAVPLFCLVLSPLAGCASTQQAAPPQAGPPCGPLIAEFQDQLRQDVESGRMARDVYGRASADTRQAADACAAGREVQARSILIATKRNYGYSI
ncbi:hypothetical protein [Enterovirga sp.]|uniref:hypothetical protein n=1 Tax=Enterovirga sp. TaxID=2026350 RepID=UPI002BB68000|nr:hypothetical protein [Enterovirga sp.]HMO29915.1 hypothetical protein [Enterovirga sp.]